MISAPSRRQQSSGNKIKLILLFIAAMMSCAAPKPIAHKPPIVTPPEKEEKVKVYDPATDTYILVPRSTVKIDTVRWTEDTTSPIVKDKTVEPDKPISDHAFDIALLMPLAQTVSESSDNFDGKINRFLQYYAGVQLAAAELDSSGHPLNIHVFDTDGSAASTEDILENAFIKHTDIIVGPYEKEALETAAEFGLKHETMVVSPWLPAFNIAESNPFFVQVNPGLSSHADAITAYIASHETRKKVFLVSRNNPVEINRLTLFRKNTALQTEDLIIKDDSPDLSKTKLQELLAEEGTVFILPYYAKADESFVNSFLRKLHADKETKEVTVYGLPQWLSFTNLNTNYLESMNVHISISTFIDVDHPDYDEFRKQFLRTYHTVPDLQAFLGYDLIQWIAATTSKSGEDGMIGNSSVWFSGIASGFDIRPVYKTTSTVSHPEMNAPLYYENTRIRILQYRDQDYRLVY